MTTKDGFPPDDRYPVFLSEDAEQAEQPDIGKAWRRAAIWSRILKTGILVVAAAAIGIAIVSVGHPVALLANVTASLVDKSALRPGTDPSTPTIQANAGTQDLPPPAGDAPMRDETAAARETEISQPPAEGLLKQFQAWAAEEDTRAQAGPVQPVQDAEAQVVQGAPAQVAQDALAQVRPMRRHRQVRHVQNARAEIRPERQRRAKVRREHIRRARVQREQDAQAQVRPAQDARAQDQSAQNAQLPWLLQGFGLRN